MNRNHKQCVNHPNFWVAHTKSMETNKIRRNNQREQYLKNPNKCKQCKTIIPYEKRLDNIYCSCSCRTSAINLARKKKTKICKCGNNIDNQSHLYCSTECRTNSRKERVMNNALTNNTIHNRKTLKKYIIESRGYQCEICKNSEWLSNPIPLELHHINGLANDNTWENLQLICPNCHTFTPYHKGKNKGRGRKALGIHLA